MGGLLRVLGVMCETFNDECEYHNSTCVKIAGGKYYVPSKRVGFIRAGLSGTKSSKPYVKDVLVHKIEDNDYLVGFNDEMGEWRKVWVQKKDLFFKKA
tara:strand:+ start:2199 stop:2492 length:294 start_codon:yes stop_codon:yes gene_type:complete